jgi:hypothetical protein
MSHWAKSAGLLAVVLLCLPLQAAAVRARPQGLYTYRLTGTESYAGHTYQSRDRGTLTLSGARINGQTNDGEATFALRLANRVNRQSVQTTQATGNLTLTESEGVSQGKLTANVRLQKTRTGVWKVTLNYAGVIKSGVLRGGTLAGKLVAKSG